MSQEQNKRMDGGGGLASNDTLITTIPTTIDDPSAPPRLPDELMLMIYDLCPRSTLRECLLLDHQQFDLVVKSLWRTVDSPDLNLYHIKWLVHDNTNPVRRSAYLSAIRTYRALSWPSARKRFEPVEELPYIAEHCPNIRRLDCSFYACDLTFWRGPAESWTEVELYVKDIDDFMDYGFYAESFSETVFTPELPDLTLTRLAIDTKPLRDPFSHQDSDDCLESFIDWVLPELDGLRTLEIGPYLGKIPQMVRLFAPTIDKLWLCGDLGDGAIEVIVEQLTVLPGMRDFAFCPSWSGYPGEGTSPGLKKALSGLSLQTITCIIQPSQMDSPDRNEAFWNLFDSTVSVRFIHEYDTLFYKEPWIQEKHPVLHWERKLLKEMDDLARGAGQAETRS